MSARPPLLGDKRTWRACRRRRAVTRPKGWITQNNLERKNARDYRATFVLVIVNEAKFLRAKDAPSFIDDRDVQTFSIPWPKKPIAVSSASFLVAFVTRNGGSPGRFETD